MSADFIAKTATKIFLNGRNASTSRTAAANAGFTRDVFRKAKNEARGEVYILSINFRRTPAEKTGAKRRRPSSPRGAARASATAGARPREDFRGSSKKIAARNYSPSGDRRTVREKNLYFRNQIVEQIQREVVEKPVLRLHHAPHKRQTEYVVVYALWMLGRVSKTLLL